MSNETTRDAKAVSAPFAWGRSRWQATHCWNKMGATSLLKVVTGFSATGIINRADFNFGSKYPAAMLGNDIKFTIDVEASK